MATSSSRDPEQDSPSFFKVIRDPSAPHLSLPNAFVRKYLKKIPKTPTLVTATGEHSWRLEFVKIGEDYCFAHGWDKLATDVQLCIRDIVVFWLIDPLTFLVTFLGSNGCEKDVPSNDDDVVGQRHHEVMSDKNLSFRKELSMKTFKTFMSLPLQFVKDAGLEHTPSIKLKDHEGQEWTMGILAERYRRTRYSLSRGWALFCRHHRLSAGDVCVFTFSKEEGVLSLTQVLKSKRPINQEPMEEVNRNRGRPSCFGGGQIKIEDDWSPAEKPCNNGSGGVKVKIEYDSGPEMEVAKKKMDRPRPEKPSRAGGVSWEAAPMTDRVFRSNHVIYF